MKRLILTAYILFSNIAYGQQLPNSTFIKDLPPSLAIVIKDEILMHRAYDGTGFFSYKDSYVRKLDINRGFDIQCNSPQVIKASPNAPVLLYVSHIKPYALPSRSGEYSFSWNTITFKFSTDDIPPSSLCKLKIDVVDSQMPETVGDILKFVGNKIEFIDSDPYADLDNQTATLVIMKKITASIESERYIESLPYFSLLERRGGELPESFFYHYTKALQQAGDKEKSMKYAKKYLSKYGKDGKYYLQVVDIIARL
jgi:hypothetical protein